MRRPLAATLVPVVLVARRRRRIGLPRAFSQALVATAPAIVAASAPRSRARHAVTWLAHMWAYKVSFEIPYDRPERLRARLNVDEVPALDARIGGGEVPTARLQRRLRSPDSVNALDRALTALYMTWELEPHAALGWILFKRPEHFARAATRLAATFDATLIGYWLFPAAPPWWASEKHGLMGGDVRRVPTRVIRDLRGEPLDQDDVEGSNPWAAMPSDHFASAVSTAVVLVEAAPRAGAAAGVYAAALGFALVYLGEHYVSDLAAGLGVVALVFGTEPVVRPLAERAERAWLRVEPAPRGLRRLSRAARRARSSRPRRRRRRGAPRPRAPWR
jgi:membrane-associated phospholipid phosphatase